MEETHPSSHKPELTHAWMHHNVSIRMHLLQIHTGSEASMWTVTMAIQEQNKYVKKWQPLTSHHLIEKPEFELVILAHVKNAHVLK